MRYLIGRAAVRSAGWFATRSRRATGCLPDAASVAFPRCLALGLRDRVVPRHRGPTSRASDQADQRGRDAAEVLRLLDAARQPRHNLVPHGATCERVRRDLHWHWEITACASRGLDGTGLPVNPISPERRSGSRSFRPDLRLGERDARVAFRDRRVFRRPSAQSRTGKRRGAPYPRRPPTIDLPRPETHAVEREDHCSQEMPRCGSREP